MLQYGGSMAGVKSMYFKFVVKLIFSNLVKEVCDCCMIAGQGPGRMSCCLCNQQPCSQLTVSSYSP